jgi:hypothetical protein
MEKDQAAVNEHDAAGAAAEQRAHVISLQQQLETKKETIATVRTRLERVHAADAFAAVGE